MNRVLRERFADWNQKHTIFIDCRTITRLPLPVENDQHTGQHPMIVKRACDNVEMFHCFDVAIMLVFAVAHARWYHKTGVRVVVYAARGITVAPSFALILEHLLQASELHSDIEIKTDMEHLCHRIMSERHCGVCSG